MFLVLGVIFSSIWLFGVASVDGSPRAIHVLLPVAVACIAAHFYSARQRRERVACPTIHEQREAAGLTRRN